MILRLTKRIAGCTDKIEIKLDCKESAYFSSLSRVLEEVFSALPEENVSNAKEWNEECFSPNSAHAQFSTDHLFRKIVFQHTKQEEFAIGSLDAVTINVPVHRYLDVRTESQLDVCICIIPVGLTRK